MQMNYVIKYALFTYISKTGIWPHINTEMCILDTFFPQVWKRTDCGELTRAWKNTVLTWGVSPSLPWMYPFREKQTEFINVCNLFPSPRWDLWWPTSTILSDDWGKFQCTLFCSQQRQPKSDVFLICPWLTFISHQYNLISDWFRGLRARLSTIH